MTPDLPDAIWLPGRSPSVYSGTPLEMVASMATEMGADLSTREAIEHLLAALAENRDVVIGLPAQAADEDLARLFVIALLESGLARTMAAA